MARPISTAETDFNARIVVAFQAGATIPEIVQSFRVQTTIVYRVLRAAGLVETGRR